MATRSPAKKATAPNLVARAANGVHVVHDQTVAVDNQHEAVVVVRLYFVEDAVVGTDQVDLVVAGHQGVVHGARGKDHARDLRRVVRRRRLGRHAGRERVQRRHGVR